LTTIVTRAGKGSPLTNTEVDSNFTNLNAAKIETLTSTDNSVTITGTNSSRDLSVVIDDNVTGVLTAPTITVTGSGSTISVSSVTANLHAAPLWQGVYKTYTIPAATGLALTDNSANYLVVSYNSGSPVYSITTNPSSINGSDVVGAALLWRAGTEVHYQAINWGLSTASRLNRRAVQTERYLRASGLAIGETTGRVITVASGVVWYGVNEYPEAAVTSASSNAEFYYHVSGVWTKSVVSTYNNTQYDNGTDLVTLSGTGTQYAVNWVYRYLDGDGLPKLAYILGSGNYTLAQAQAATVSTPPPILSTMAILVGRIIVAQNASTATQIDSAFTQTFSGSSVTAHNDLAGIQGGTGGENYHLTSAEYTGTGTGNFVRANSPTLVTPALGTPSALVATNATGTAASLTAGNATKLSTGRTIAITGDLAYTSTSFDGSANVTAAGTLATVNANVGSFTNASVTVNAKGLVTAASSGTAPVTSVTGTAPVVSSGGTTPAISMAAATTAVSGYLTSTDWNTFNNKSNTTGTVTSVSATAGTGISISGSPITSSGTLTITNTAPDQTVAISSGTGISVTGTYPNFTVASTVTGASITDDTTTAATYYPLFSTVTTGSLSAVRVSSTKYTYNPSTGVLSSTVHTSTSDERLKTNWRPVAANFVCQLANVKSGIFDRTDFSTTDVGVGAQSLQPLLPQAVITAEDGYLSVNYGGAALVAAIELAKVVEELRAEIAMLKAKVGE
jgi:hypothetical protein